MTGPAIELDQLIVEDFVDGDWGKLCTLRQDLAFRLQRIVDQLKAKPEADDTAVLVWEVDALLADLDAVRKSGKTGIGSAVRRARGKAKKRMSALAEAGVAHEKTKPCHATPHPDTPCPATPNRALPEHSTVTPPPEPTTEEDDHDEPPMEPDLADEMADELDEAEQWPIDPPSLSDGSDVKQNGDHFKSGPDSAGPQVIEPESARLDPAEEAAQFSEEARELAEQSFPIAPYGWRSRVSRWWRRVAEPVVDMIQVILRVVADWWQHREVKVISVPSATVQMFNGRAGIQFATTSRFKSTLWVDMSRETLEELRAKLDTINAMLEGDG